MHSQTTYHNLQHMKFEIISVTPELAQEWLSLNASNNRPLRRDLVNAYALEIAQGNWQLTGEAIKFDQDNRLIDGQHRLNAVLVAQQTVLMPVVTGLDPATIGVIDTGKSRNAADSLTILGVEDRTTANSLAALARKIIAYRKGGENMLGDKMLGTEVMITNRQIVDLCTATDLVPYVQFGASLSRRQRVSIFSKTEWMFLYWLLCQTSCTAAATFLSTLAAPTGLMPQNPIWVLYEKLVKSQIPLSSRQRLQAVLFAWNAWRKGQSLTAIHVSQMNNELPVAV
ncbi:MAG TPA: hypothetical protein PLM33_10690 [Acidobacteriota bacterium]|nr:hypothetical protein [Acidobacteriota bacterium]